MISSLKDALVKNRVWHCLDCGKCSSVCPITRWERRTHTSPRLLVEKVTQGCLEDILDDPLFWSCLTCQRCSDICPSDVRFAEFLRDVRYLVHGETCRECTHAEVIQTWGRIMTRPDLEQNRLGWLDCDLHVSDHTDTLFFVGCLPYYDSMFKQLGFEGIQIARAAIKILNHLGIEPQVFSDERCCGHDQLWQGDMEGFRLLAESNLALFTASGVRQIVATCPECVRTLKLDYPQFIGNHGIKVMHITELMHEKDLFVKPAETEASPKKVTYQDPCRLGRSLGIYEAPRWVIEKLGFELTEMERSRNSSLCCGTSCWTACGQVSKNIQVERLQEAIASQAELLVTACPKCQIHFKCAQGDTALAKQIDIQIRDLTTLVAERLG